MFKFMCPVFVMVALAGCGDSALPVLPALPVVSVPVSTPAPVLTPKVFDQIAADSTVAGSFTATSVDYRFGRMTVKDEVSNGTYESDIHGIAWYPAGLTGKAPVLVWLHGRHQTCQTTVGEAPVVAFGDDDCPQGTPALAPAASYTGYNAAAQLLASQGYVVLSIDLNDVNDNDNSDPTDKGALARAQLALRHLDEFRIIDQSGGRGFDALKGHLDFNRVGLMGHSRGGIAIMKAAQENLKRPPDQAFGIKAIFGLAADTGGLNIGATAYQVPPNVVWGAAHGWCDGDAPDFFSAFYFDKNRQAAQAPRILFIPMGANHNYYNTAWSGTDDWQLQDASQTDSQCGSVMPGNPRDSTSGQQGQLKQFMTSFFRCYVGGETRFAPLFQGRTQVPTALCPNGSSASCVSRFPTQRYAGAQDRLLVDDFTSLNNALGGSTDYLNFSSNRVCTPTDGGSNPAAGGLGCPASPTFNRIPQRALAWQGAASLTSRFPAQNVQAFDNLSVRVGLGTQAVDFVVVLTDVNGKTARQNAKPWSEGLFLPPGRAYSNQGSQNTLLFSTYIPTKAFAGVDLQRITAISLEFSGSGSGQFTDLMFQRADSFQP